MTPGSLRSVGPDRILQKESASQRKGRTVHRSAETGEVSMERDPVCGMEVKDIPEAPRAVHEGRTYVFCSESCRERFEESPGSFTGGSGETM